MGADEPISEINPAACPSGPGYDALHEGLHDELYEVLHDTLHGVLEKISDENPKNKKIKTEMKFDRRHESEEIP